MALNFRPRNSPFICATASCKDFVSCTSHLDASFLASTQMKETPIGLPDCPPQRVLIEVFDCAPARQKGRLIFGRKSRRQLAYPATGFLRVQRGIVQARFSDDLRSGCWLSCGRVLPPSENVVGVPRMSKGLEIRCYDYVNHPYARVRDVLRQDALNVFQTATKAAASRAQSVAAELHVDLGGISVKADIRISIKNIEDRIGDAMSGPDMRLLLEWEAATAPGLFPLMKAELSVYPLTSTETQLDFAGLYEPPLGAVGRAMNAVAGHRIAEASVHRFVNEVAEYLRQTLAATRP